MRLIIDPPADGPINMARDEVLLDGVSVAGTQPTLRLYRWNPPTLSLGYFQKFADYEELAAPAGDLAVVRRTTGGGAILHDLEWTYSLALPGAHPLCHPDPRRLYEVVHDAVIDMLGRLGISARRCGETDDSAAHRGPLFCFDRRHCLDVVVEQGKLAGSAQRRTRHAVLQHGSILIGNRFDQHGVAAIGDFIEVSADDVLPPLLEALRRRMKMDFEEGAWRESEDAAMPALRAKYAGLAWTRKY